MNFVRLKQELKIRRYSAKTAKAYLHYNKQFLLFCKKEEVSRQDVRDYLEHLADKRSSASTMRLAYNSLLFYYTQILRKDIMQNIKIPKKDQKITIGLTPEEVAKLISVIKNPQHRLLIELIYASGVRAQEAVRIKVNDILVEEKLAVVRAGKGNKDRKTILSERFINDFKKELQTDNYLFKGRTGHLTVRSVQQIIKKAALDAGIKKRVYPHLLRHAFATHLHQNKTDVRYIQKLLGHKDQKTTENYVSVSDSDIKKIRSPHDNIKWKQNDSLLNG
ncbi:MAG: tyrosine-type recombinase/integrase [Nanoarchaeota archaeon]|nr:tyrosine-type recombinase/integrase [Nanoarchaeota archaeon]MBU1631842.1 tyrosine-type recombinase/integrase [Nanoarchaeota archaeon]MBU1875835.1 tyrosine-type recombinase/integrase [Nanoarchaeota archaeon]